MTPGSAKLGEIANKVAFAVTAWSEAQHVGHGFAAETGYFTRGDGRTVRASDFSSFIRNERTAISGDHISSSRSFTVASDCARVARLPPLGQPPRPPV